MTKDCKNTNLMEACSARINLVDYERNYNHLQEEILGPNYTNDGGDSYRVRSLTTEDIIEKFVHQKHTIRFLTVSLCVASGALIMCAIEIVKMFL